mgnify:CR=1 FL=1|jgi:histidyl-tRNA synthetase
MLTRVPRGTRDILPEEAAWWQLLEEKIRTTCKLFGYQEIRTPVFEHTELFTRSVGEVTDIVAKEMYTFTDRGDRQLTLRPEGTASVARAYLENNLQAKAQPVKLYYTGPMFRYDRPQAGRYRQFHQFGVEVFGSQDAAVDAEVILLALFFFSALGLKEFSLQVNSVGCPRCRGPYRGKLQEYLKEQLSGLCSDCAERYEKNPLRVLDCKKKSCQGLLAGVPLLTDSLCHECEEHFKAVCGALDELGVEYEINPRLVRGLDYYTKTAFEIISPALGAQSSICGGGRYDNLIATIGGPDIPGIGFAVGIERVLLALQKENVPAPAENATAVFVARAGVSSVQALQLTMELRRAGLPAETDFLGRSLKAQLKYADKKGIRYAVLLGAEELQKGQAAVRDMRDGTQQAVDLPGLADYLAAQLKEAE